MLGVKNKKFHEETKFTNQKGKNHKGELLVIQAKQQGGPIISTEDVYGLVKKHLTRKYRNDTLDLNQFQNVLCLFHVRERGYLHGIGWMDPKPVVMLVKTLYN